MARKSRQARPELDLSAFPPGATRRYSRWVCLACIFDIYTKQLGLGPRTAYSEVKRHTPSVEELTGRAPVRPCFAADEKSPHCPYCGSAKRWLARLETIRIEGGKVTDAVRRKLSRTLPKTGGQFLLLEKKSTSREIFFEWLDALGRTCNFDEDGWLIDTVKSYLERKDPKTDWAELFDGVSMVRPSSRLEEGWTREDRRLFLAPPLYNEVLLVQYLVSRSHRAGGRTLQGRLTLVELLRRLRNAGYLREHGITERDQFEVLEKLVDELTGGEAGAKLHYIVDRREFLERLKEVYATRSSTSVQEARAWWTDRSSPARPSVYGAATVTSAPLLSTPPIWILSAWSPAGSSGTVKLA
jgi:hypothetical protein